MKATLHFKSLVLDTRFLEELENFLHLAFTFILRIDCSSGNSPKLSWNSSCLRKSPDWSLFGSYRMRLLNTTTFELEEFFGSNIPSYSIVSHVHGSAEVTLQDLLNGQGQSKEGWEKILGCCAQARKDGWRYTVRDPQDFCSFCNFVQQFN